MTSSQTVSLDPDLIPPIGGKIPQSFTKIPEKKPRFNNEPNEVSLGGFFGKIFIGLAIG